MRKLPVFGLVAISALALGCGGAGQKGTTQGPGVAASDAGKVAGTSKPDPANAGTDKAAQPDDGKRDIVFEVTGKGVTKATSITYGIGGNTSQANNAKVPWKKQATSADSFLILSLVAQSGGSGGGTISCRITVDGKVLVENSSQGQYAVVTCSESA
jgi:hypothetical protein